MPAHAGTMNKPNWWASQDANAWERVKETLRRDWDQTKHDLHMGGHELNQKLADTVGQAVGKESIPAIDKANPPKVIGRFDDAEMPLGYGYAARTHFGDRYPLWNDELEGKLRSDWNADKPWPEIKHFVRRGYDLKR
jgi:hypothetical protein